MSTIERYFNIFNEGATDYSHRKTLLDVYRMLLKTSETLSPKDIGNPKPGTVIASVNVGELSDSQEFSDLELWFIPKSKVTTKGRFVAENKNHPNRIEIFVQTPEKVFTSLTPEKWSKVVAKNASVILERAREVFWHEFTHYKDIKKAGPAALDASIAAKKSKDLSRYYNDPLEYNAFLQQGFTKIQHYLDGKSKHEVEKVLGKNAEEFFKKVVSEVISQDMKKHLSSTFMNKVKKRTYQMWKEIMNNADRSNKNDR